MQRGYDNNTKLREAIGEFKEIIYKKTHTHLWFKNVSHYLFFSFTFPPPSPFTPLFYIPSSLYPPSYTTFFSSFSFLCYLFPFFFLLLLLFLDSSSSPPPGKYQNRFYPSRAKNISALKLSPSGQSKNTFCPGKQNKKVWLRDAASQPPGGKWAKGSSLHFLGTETMAELASLLSTHTSSSSISLEYKYIMAILWRYGVGLGGSSQKPETKACCF